MSVSLPWGSVVNAPVWATWSTSRQIANASSAAKSACRVPIPSKLAQWVRARSAKALVRRVSATSGSARVTRLRSQARSWVPV